MHDRPVLVLNADYRPLSWFPLSVCSWQNAVKALFMDRVDVAATYDDQVHSPSFSMKMPSVIVLKRWVNPRYKPPFTPRNLMIRDLYTCQYCGKEGGIFGMRKGVRLTLDHVHPKSRGGERSWNNMVASCQSCNGKKGALTPEEALMPLAYEPYTPTMKELWANSSMLAPEGHIPQEWRMFLVPDEAL